MLFLPPGVIASPMTEAGIATTWIIGMSKIVKFGRIDVPEPQTIKKPIAPVTLKIRPERREISLVLLDCVR